MVELLHVDKAFGDKSFFTILATHGKERLFWVRRTRKTTLLRLIAGLEKPDSGD